ncbi:hypothetical protein JTE90_001221 [Oedothorax gibbosus]|uniref:Ig-like domain-containing protein n=1 Tax=Oedothorax gibbosus TaxID=931172 RepID=A0AAV6UVJ6_9ARAC|nr:hypothetical protein JTE90_001221 [Oedothorax gibbosus]
MEEIILGKQLLLAIICGLLCIPPVAYSINLTSTTTFIQKGGGFELACQVAGLGMHLWYKDGKPIVPSAINKFHLESGRPFYDAEKSDYFTTMRLFVREASAIHSGDYKCNNAGIYSQRVVIVTEDLIKTNEDIPGVGKVLDPGEPLTLQCNTTDCKLCNVIWFKNGIQVHAIPGRISMHNKNNSMVINSATYNDSGMYVCALDRKHLDVALNASISVQSKIKLERFDNSAVVTEGSPLEIFCKAKGAPTPLIKWFIGDQEIFEDDDRIKLLDHEGLKKGKLLIEEADYDDRNHYTCEAYNQVDAVNTTVFIRVKGKLAALWPFLGICAEVAILGTIIFVYERKKSMNQCDEPDTALPSDNKHRDQKGKGQDVRQRK